jgi:flagellar motor switch protein FliM
MTNSNTLSQSEIDRLLDGNGGVGTSPNAAATTPRKSDSAQLYDFRRPHRISKERLRTLEAMYERMAKGLESWVIGRVRDQIEMRLQSVEQFSFGEFTLSLSSPCAAFIFNVNDSGGQQGIFDIGQDFAFYLVDRLFGGNGRQPCASRPLTRVERMALRSIVERATALLVEVWADHIPLQLDISSFESFPDILNQNGNRDDPVLAANIEVTVGDVSSLLLICLPFTVLDKFFTHTGKRRMNSVTGSEQERAASREIAEQTLRITNVNVSARLPEFRMSMRDIASLSEGGIIQTALPHDSQVCVRVGSQQRFVGTVGRCGNKLAVRIADVVSTDTGMSPNASTASLQFDPNFLPSQA